MSNFNIFPLRNISDNVWLNGQFINFNDAKIHLLTHSLHYGGSVFEGEKAYNGKIFKIEEHTERLFHSAKSMKLNIPYTKEEIISATHELLKINNLENAYIRPLAWRSTDTMMVKPINPTTNLMIAAWKPLKKPHSPPLKLHVSRWFKAANNAVPVQCKTSAQYSMYIVSMIEANDLGFDDAILLDPNGIIAECTTSNIFFTHKDQLFTPTTSYALNGITRQTVIELAKQHQCNVIEKDILPSDLGIFDGCFLTGTAVGIQSVASIVVENNQYHFKNSNIFNIIESEYSNLVKNIP